MQEVFGLLWVENEFLLGVILIDTKLRLFKSEAFVQRSRCNTFLVGLPKGQDDDVFRAIEAFKHEVDEASCNPHSPVFGMNSHVAEHIVFGGKKQQAYNGVSIERAQGAFSSDVLDRCFSIVVDLFLGFKFGEIPSNEIDQSHP